MKRNVILSILILVSAIAAAGGYWFGTRRAHAPAAPQTTPAISEKSAAESTTMSPFPKFSQPSSFATACTK